MTPATKKPASSTQKSVAAPARGTGMPKARLVGVVAVQVEPSLRFHHSQNLRHKTLTLLDAIEACPKQGDHGTALADLVADLVEAGMDYYFLRGLQQADVGFLTEQSARLGMTGAVKLITSVSRKFIVRMDGAQLQAIATHIRSLT